MPAPEANGPSTITGRPLRSPTGSRPRPVRVAGSGAPALRLAGVGEQNVWRGGTAMTYPAVGKNADLRPQAELFRERDVHALEARRAMGFDRGAYDTLNWLITGADGPLTGQMVGLAPSRRGDRARTGRGRGHPVRNIVFAAR